MTAIRSEGGHTNECVARLPRPVVRCRGFTNGPGCGATCHSSSPPSSPPAFTLASTSLKSFCSKQAMAKSQWRSAQSMLAANTMDGKAQHVPQGLGNTRSKWRGCASLVVTPEHTAPTHSLSTASAFILASTEHKAVRA